MITGQRLALRDAAAATLLLIAGIWLGSGGGRHLDPALNGYLAATLVAFFAVVRRTSAFWRRPASAIYGRVLRAAWRQPRAAVAGLRRGADDLVAQRFIARRSRVRWLAHLALAFGTLASFAITVPLVFGWLHFEAIGQSHYLPRLFDLPAGPPMAIDGVPAWLIFHGLSLAGVAVALGAAALLVLRWRARLASGALAWTNLAPLLLLLSVALSGLALPATRGMPWAFDLAAALHEALVIVLLLAFASSKLTHVLIRPLQIGARLLHAEAERRVCEGCAAPFAPLSQQLAVAALLQARGARFGARVQLCPACRRRATARTQSNLIDSGFQPDAVATGGSGRREAA